MEIMNYIIVTRKEQLHVITIYFELKYKIYSKIVI